MNRIKIERTEKERTNKKLKDKMSSQIIIDGRKEGSTKETKGAKMRHLNLHKKLCKIP